MTIRGLIEAGIDIDLPIRIVTDESNDDGPNLWIGKVEQSSTGTSGYTIQGEVRLITTE